MRLQAGSSGWVVLWGVWTRKFWAFALFTAEPVVVDAPDTGTLLAQMAQVELLYGLPGVTPRIAYGPPNQQEIAPTLPDLLRSVS